MQVSCDQCQSKFNLSDEKIPEGGATLRCPKCQNKITVQPETQEPVEDYDSEEKPFDFIEEEEKTALLCEPDPLIREKISSVLNMLEYHVTVCDTARDALKRMRYHLYDLIVLNEYFDTPNPDANSLMIYLSRLPIATRRNIFVLLLSPRFRTLDAMTALHKSVNVILNPQNIHECERVLKRGLTEHDLFYRVFRETQKKFGRA